MNISLETRADLIAAKRGVTPGSMRWNAIRDFALQQLKEVADLARAGVEISEKPPLPAIGKEDAQDD